MPAWSEDYGDDGSGNVASYKSVRKRLVYLLANLRSGCSSDDATAPPVIWITRHPGRTDAPSGRLMAALGSKLRHRVSLTAGTACSGTAQGASTRTASVRRPAPHRRRRGTSAARPRCRRSRPRCTAGTTRASSSTTSGNRAASASRPAIASSGRAASNSCPIARTRWLARPCRCRPGRTATVAASCKRLHPSNCPETASPPMTER